MPTDGERQIEFAYNCSKAAGLDLTDFFVKWGFLKSGSYEFNDSYGDGKVVVFTVNEDCGDTNITFPA